MQTQAFTVSIYTENNLGLLNRVTSIFLKRHINIDSLTVSESEIPHVHRFTIVVKTNTIQIQKIVLQLEKQVEVIRAYYHKVEETIFQEIALYKISSESLYKGELQDVIKNNYARIVEIEPEFLVVEKNGTYEETKKLYEELIPFGLMQFVRSGRIAVTRPKMLISEILKQ
ncbi:MAG: acetolactate synthase small subunit [Bacteroidetes bacterium HGW-Bacteroidetes-13]|jgi:acetolactate synthase-1/3 small subunit|nr:MAG: acetolactate synthase small subunit [Bacteroidetes bacterium HGW-Bacteroidetes-13]